MGTTLKREGGAGFAVFEAILILVIVLGVVGAGFYVYTKNHKNSTNNSATTTTTTTANVPLNGTSTSVDQMLQAESQSETSAETSADAQNQQVVTNANTAANNVGSAYNENTL